MIVAVVMVAVVALGDVTLRFVAVVAMVRLVAVLPFMR